MNITPITDTFAVAPQIQIADLASLADQGFCTVICNRPDDEAGAVPSAALREAASRHGLAFHYIPVTPGVITEAQIAETASVIGAAQGPVLAFCRSGNRSTLLFRAAMT